MTYATLDDLTKRAGPSDLLDIADRDEDGVADGAVIDAALVEADGIIDGYLASRYALPLVSVPEIVVSWAISIARYKLHRFVAPDNVIKDYNDAIQSLKDVAKGMIHLPPSAGTTPQPTDGQYLVEAPAEFFGCKTLRGWL